MKAFKYLLFLLLITIIGISIYIAIQPNTFEVKRAYTIKAPKSVIYNHIIDFKNWKNWSPWIEKDPTIQTTFGEKTKGIGGSQSWTGKDGYGNIKTTETTPYSSIKQLLQFNDYQPSEIIWNLESITPKETKITWHMINNKTPFILKGFAAISGGFDNMIGPSFERGLIKLDSVASADINKYSIKTHGITLHGGGYYLYITTSCKITDLKNKKDNMMLKVKNYAKNNRIKMAGAPFIFYHKWDEENNATVFSCCIPTTEKTITPLNSDILTGLISPFNAVKATLKGDYKNLKNTWKTLLEFASKNNLQLTENGPMLEVYETTPADGDNPSNWITQIYIAVTD